MPFQDHFISTSELQQNIAKTIEKAKREDIIIIRNNKLEAAIIGIDKYNQFLEYLEWKKISDALDNMPVEQLSKAEAEKDMIKLAKGRLEPRFSAEDIEKIAESGEEYDL